MRDKNQFLMHMAEEISTRGTCSRLKVGVIFARDARIIATGYNGAPKGLPHCDHACDCLPITALSEVHHVAGCSSLLPCLVSSHAEANAIAFAARHGVSLEGTTMYVTHSPCYNCAMLIINAGVDRVLYRTKFRDTAGADLLREARIITFQLLTSDDIF